MKENSMKKVKSLISIILVCSFCFCLSSCGNLKRYDVDTEEDTVFDEEDAEGTWTGTYFYDGNSMFVELVLNKDGTYDETLHRNGRLYKNETGRWKIVGDEVRLYFYITQNIFEPYTVTNGKLVSGKIELTKKDK